MWLSLITLSICLFSLCNDYRLASYRVLMNPFFWFTLLFLFYMVLPSIFSEEINYYYSWEIDQDSIFYARIIVFNVGVSLSLLLLVFRSSSISFKPFKTSAKPILLYAIWFVIVLYLFWVAKNLLTGEIFSAAFLYDVGAAKDPYKLKNVAYLLIPITTYMFFHTRSYWVFLPSLMIVCLDFLHGSRTTAFICIVPFLLCAVVNNKKLYLPQLLFLFFVMIVVGIVRSDNVVQEVPWYLNAIGEFRETYITLPMFISDANYVGAGEIFGYVGTLFLGIAQPIRNDILDSYDLPGRFMAEIISRGYGLGSNFLIEPLYYGYGYIFFSLFMLICFLFLVYKFVSKVEMNNAVILLSIFVIFSRLIVREGVAMNISLFAFISVFYWGVIYFSSRICFFRYSRWLR